MVISPKANLTSHLVMVQNPLFYFSSKSSRIKPINNGYDNTTYWGDKMKYMFNLEIDFPVYSDQKEVGMNCI